MAFGNVYGVAVANALAPVFMTVSAVGAITGGVLAYGGTKGFLSVSRLCARAEEKADNMDKTAFKIAKWVFLGLAGCVGLGGSILAGASSGLTIAIATELTLGPVASGAAIVVGVVGGLTVGIVSGALVLKSVIGQACKYTKPPIKHY